MNTICNLEKHYLLNVDPVKFIDSLECGYIFNNWIESDLYLYLNYDKSSLYLNYDKSTTTRFNNISIVAIYNIISNLVSIFYYDQLSAKHKKEFSNIKPFALSNTFHIDIKCDTFSFSSQDDVTNISSFIYEFNGGTILIKDSICTKNLSVYEHKIFIPNTSSSDFLTNCLFLYESFVDNIIDKIEYF